VHRIPLFGAPKVDVDRRLLALRALAASAVLLLVPIIVVLSTLSDEAPIQVGQPSPRTIEVRDRPIEVRDEEATAEARSTAASNVEPVEVSDNEARQAVSTAVRDMFAAVRLARAPVEVPNPAVSVGPDGEPTGPETTTREPTEAEQLADLQEDIEFFGEEGLRELVQLTDTQLQRVENETIEVIQELLRLSINQDELEQVLSSDLQEEIVIRSWPGDVASEVVDPLVRAVMQPTVRIDNEETERRREAAEESVEDVFRRWEAGDVIVEEGEVVTSVQFQALDQLGEAGSDLGVAFARALTAMVLIIVVVGMYLHRSQRPVWNEPGRLFVLAAVIVLSAGALAGVAALADTFGSGWWFAFPVGGIVLLISVLISPQVGTMSVLPLAGVALLMAPALPALAIFVTAMTVLAAPLAGGVSTRVGLRRAGVRVGLAAPLIAAAVALVFGPRDQYVIVIGAAALGGIAGAGILQGLLPAFENLFKLATVTALLDLADRNHPLLRELEAKAIGSYNHSVMVASLTERCCREIGANHLLGQVAALYHDIGKVRQPHFFIENQRGIANPHDELEPRVSAVIIQNHVKDGVEMAERHRLPPDVVSCIGSHHGTMLVTYFYRQAIAQAGGDKDAVEEGHFRYKGHRPRSKEAAVLLLADCCEATTRAMAMDRGTLPGDEIEQIVDRLLTERVEDHQFDECDLTFVELQKVRDTLVDALTGIYHPRIQYPGQSAA